MLLQLSGPVEKGHMPPASDFVIVVKEDSRCHVVSQVGTSIIVACARPFKETILHLMLFRSDTFPVEKRPILIVSVCLILWWHEPFFYWATQLCSETLGLFVCSF